MPDDLTPAELAAFKAGKTGLHAPSATAWESVEDVAFDNIPCEGVAIFAGRDDPAIAVMLGPEAATHAARIVRAVNNHDALVAALEAVSERFPAHGLAQSEDSDLGDLARAALANARRDA